MRSTREMRRLAAVLLAGDDDARFYGGFLRRAANVHSPRLNLMLTTLLQRSWLTDGWDEPSQAGGQRYYTLTEAGRRELARK
ncbi:hypothetical protein [Amycolatopsis sp. NPDC058986]|uniref:hypothetical protein n=1 Tax=unclassified Amycolatopsis TaxID=2618356 RepID=UPI003670D91C